MVFVEGTPGYLILGATLLAVGNVFFEFASVNYNAMLVQVSTRENMTGVYPRPEHAVLPQLWARTRIARLSDFAVDGSEDAREVTKLGLNYALLTRFTSFIAVLEKVRVRPGSSVDVEQPLPLPAGVEDSAVGEFNSGAEPELWLLMLLGAAGLVFMKPVVGSWYIVRIGLDTPSNTL